MVARVPDSEPRMSPWNFRCRAYQFAALPESAATIALSGSREDSSWKIRIGLIGSAPVNARRSTVAHQSATAASICSRHSRSSFRTSSGSSARSVVFASPTRLISYGYRMPIHLPDRSICTALACPRSGRNWVYGKLEPTVNRVSQPIISS